MKTNYEKAREFAQAAESVDDPAIYTGMVALAQVYATLALADATRDR